MARVAKIALLSTCSILCWNVESKLDLENDDQPHQRLTINHALTTKFNESFELILFLTQLVKIVFQGGVDVDSS